jgi:hypothetical protein
MESTSTLVHLCFLTAHETDILKLLKALPRLGQCCKVGMVFVTQVKVVVAVAWGFCGYMFDCNDWQVTRLKQPSLQRWVHKSIKRAEADTAVPLRIVNTACLRQSPEPVPCEYRDHKNPRIMGC